MLFAHWRVPLRAVRALVPPALEVETFDGSAWVGVLPFRLTGFRVRGLFAAPRLSSFPELNVRTYVTANGKRGIFFISLDAARRWAVVGARRLYRLPYFLARMSITKGDWIDFSSDRIGEARTFRARYRAGGRPLPLERGTIEHFLTERYRLYTSDGSRLLCGDAHHVPWAIQPAQAEIVENTMVPEPIELRGDPLLHYAARQDALIWPLRQAGG